MDTTKQYILMCEKAKEIQKEWKPRLDDIIFDKMTSHTEILGLLIDTSNKYYQFWEGTVRNNDITLFSNYILLLHQDQLQEMLDFGGNPKWWPKLNGLSQFADKGWQASNIKPYHHPYRSFEQLWLAFVMKEKYNKIWTGNEWKIK